MCGIFGWSFDRTPRKGALTILAAGLSLANDTRGGDSWGYYAPRRAFLSKGTGSISCNVRASTLARWPMLMAHTRKATTGEVKTANAHPFQLKTIVGAHNGIVSNHERLNRVFKRDCAVDSEHIFRHLEDGEDLRELEAWGAVEYVKKALPGRIHLARFNGGELSIYSVAHGVVWSSSQTSLKRALALAGLRGKEYQVKEGQVYYAADGILYDAHESIPIGAIRYVPSLFPSRVSHYDAMESTWGHIAGATEDTTEDLQDEMTASDWERTWSKAAADESEQEEYERLERELNERDEPWYLRKQV